MDEFQAHQGRINALAVLPDETFVSAGEDGWLRKWEVQNSRLMESRRSCQWSRPLLALKTGPRCCAYPLVALDATGTVFGITAELTKKSLGIALPPDPASKGFHTVFAVHPHGKLTAIGRQYSLRFYDIESQISREVANFNEGIDVVCYTPDGRELLCAHGHNIDVRDIVTGDLLVTFQATRACIRKMAISSDGVIGHFKLGHSWSLQNRPPDKDLLFRFGPVFQPVTFAADGHDCGAMQESVEDRCCRWHVAEQLAPFFYRPI